MRSQKNRPLATTRHGEAMEAIASETKASEPTVTGFSEVYGYVTFSDGSSINIPEGTEREVFGSYNQGLRIIWSKDDCVETKQVSILLDDPKSSVLHQLGMDKQPEAQPDVTATEFMHETGAIRFSDGEHMYVHPKTERRLANNRTLVITYDKGVSFLERTVTISLGDKKTDILKWIADVESPPTRTAGLSDHTVPMTSGFMKPAGAFLPDSGTRKEFSTGSVRDSAENRGRFDLITPIGLLRLAIHYERGARKYLSRNWEKGQETGRYVESMMRHLNSYMAGDRTEDHLAAVAWNAFALMHTGTKIKEGKLPDSLNTLPFPVEDL